MYAIVSKPGMPVAMHLVQQYSVVKVGYYSDCRTQVM